MGKLDVDPGVEVEKPHITAKIDSPDAKVSADVLDADVKVGGGAGVDIDLGRDRSGSHSSSDDEKDKEKKKKDKKSKGFGFGVKMPKFHGPSFGGGAKGDVDIETPDAHIDGGAKLDVDAGVEVEKPVVTAKING